MPVLLFKSDYDQPPPWREALESGMPGLEVRVFPELGDAAEIDYALVWRPPADLFTRLPNLKIIFSLGAGLDHLLNGVELPPGVPIVRMVDVALTEGMSEYALFATLYHHRRMRVYAEQQRARVWRHQLPQPRAGQVRVGVMGLGEIGGDVARKIAAVGYDVAGWSRSRKTLAGIVSFCGDAELPDFLARSDVLICVLPLTARTRGILNRDTLGQLPRGSFVVNIGRGEHLVEADLLALLDSGHIAGAALDVFATEPLPADHPLWAHPCVLVTPHVASVTNPYTASLQVIDNVQRHRAGQPLVNLVDVARGY